MESQVTHFVEEYNTRPRQQKAQPNLRRKTLISKKLDNLDMNMFHGGIQNQYSGSVSGNVKRNTNYSTKGQNYRNFFETKSSIKPQPLLEKFEQSTYEEQQRVTLEKVVSKHLEKKRHPKDLLLCDKTIKIFNQESNNLEKKSQKVVSIDFQNFLQKDLSSFANSSVQRGSKAFSKNSAESEGNFQYNTRAPPSLVPIQ